MRRLKSWLLPRSCGGWALAFLLLSLLFGALVYSVRDDLYRTYLGLQPDAQNVGKAAYAASERLELKKTAGGARVTLNSVYAEEQYIVAGFEVEDLTNGRRVGEHPAELQPLIGFEGDEEALRKQGLGTEVVELTDESGTRFRIVNNSGSVSEGPNNMARGPLQNMVAFEPEQSLEPGEKYRFRLEVPIVESPVVQMGQERPPPAEPFEGGPFVFDFELPVRAVQVVDVGQKVTAEGVTLTLDRVINSPGRPQAVLCYEAPDERLWYLHGGKGTDFGGWGSSGSMRGVTSSGCQKLLLEGPSKGRTSLNVASMEGMPDCPVDDPKAAEACYERIGDRRIDGPWRFEFEVPDP